jgi:glycosyltransferase involved in cell wall biosynthesis
MLNIYKSFKPVVSVVMASHNRAQYLNRSIDSLLSQTFKEWELLLLDDGSNDNTFEIINNYIEKNENIRYFKHKRRKLAFTRNAGIAASVGDYITFLDSDDEYDKNHLKFRVNFMQGRPDVDLIHGGIQIIGDPFVADKNNPAEKIHLEQCTIGGTFFGRRKVFTESDGFLSFDYSEDSEFLDRAKEKFVIQKVGYPTYIYHRDAEDSITNQKLNNSQNSI